MKINYKYHNALKGYFIYIDYKMINSNHFERLLKLNEISCWKIVQSLNGHKCTVNNFGLFYKFKTKEEIENIVMTLKLISNGSDKNA